MTLDIKVKNSNRNGLYVFKSLGYEGQVSDITMADSVKTSYLPYYGAESLKGSYCKL